MGRAELRRQQRAEARLQDGKKLSIETVSQKTNLKVEMLLQWRKQEHDELEHQIIQEYQNKLEKAEDIILAAMVFAAMNAVRRTWKMKLDLRRFFENLLDERDIAFSDGIEKSMKRVIDETGMEFEFDDMDLNMEFHLGDTEYAREIQRMTPNSAYDDGFKKATALGNIINTAVFADKLMDRGFTVEDIQKMIIDMNYTTREIRDGDGKVTKYLLKLKDKGFDIGESNRDLIKLYGL